MERPVLFFLPNNSRWPPCRSKCRGDASEKRADARLSVVCAARQRAFSDLGTWAGNSNCRRRVYGLRFKGEGTTSPLVTIGETIPVALEPGGDEHWDAHNLGSFTGGGCDEFVAPRYYVVLRP
jgi:hypothetical protein